MVIGKSGKMSLKYCRACIISLKVIVICGNRRYRHAMLLACELGMCNGEYVFIDPYVTSGGSEYTPWLEGDSDDDRARAAYVHVIKVNIILHHFILKT